jgi:hypothetical protein
LGEKGVDKSIILKWMLRKCDLGHRTGQVAGSCKCGNEHSGSIKYGEFLNYLKPGYILKEDSAPWSK